MKNQGLAVGWIATVIALIAGLGWTITQTIALTRSRASTEAQRTTLVRQLEASRQRMHDELAAKVDVLRDLRWSAERPTAADILRRVAELARDGHAKVSVVAPIDKEPAVQSRESSHRIEMAASFQEIVDFASKVERDGGILEDVVFEIPQTKAGEESASNGLSAQFRLTTIEPSDDARQIMRRIVTASARSPKFSLASALALPIEVQPPATSSLRDPFQFTEAPVRRREPVSVSMPATPPAVALQSPGSPPAPVVIPLTVKGIVKFPEGLVAIVNDKIVKVGDLVEGQRVEEISDGRVVFHEPGSGSRSIPLAGFAPMPPAPLMRK
jgi:hypothetical protein